MMVCIDVPQGRQKHFYIDANHSDYIDIIPFLGVFFGRLGIQNYNKMPKNLTKLNNADFFPDMV